MTGALPAWLRPLPGAERMRAADAAAIDGGTPGAELMERAGAGLARVADRVIADGVIAIVCGKGNNGGDGFVAARVLRAGGREVRVLAIATPEEYHGDAAANLARLDLAPTAFSAAALEGAAGIVDCLLGTGFDGEPRGAVAEAIAAIRAAGVPVVACDVPSGVDASTGEVAGDAVSAIATATFAAAKPGLWIAPGKAHAGAVEVIDIALGDDVGADIGLITTVVLDELPARGADSTKFSSGHVLVAGGSTGLTGALCLAAQAAARAGAGYVTACVPASLQAIFEVRLLEVMTRGLPDADGALQPAAAAGVLDATGRGGALVLGCGLGRTAGAQAFARDVAAGADVGLVLDADGRNAHAGRLDDLAARRAPTILTPHAGELARLLDTDSAAVGARRLHHVREASRRSGAIVVLKGDDTLVAHPDGRVAVSPGGAPALATAGTGDVLAGICAAYLAGGLAAFTAACAAVAAHVLAGRKAAEPHGPAGVIASDVIAALPAAMAGR